MRHCLPLVGAHGRAPLHAMGKFRRHGPLLADHVVDRVRWRNGALQPCSLNARDCRALRRVKRRRARNDTWNCPSTSVLRCVLGERPARSSGSCYVEIVLVDCQEGPLSPRLQPGGEGQGEGGLRVARHAGARAHKTCLLGAFASALCSTCRLPGRGSGPTWPPLLLHLGLQPGRERRQQSREAVSEARFTACLAQQALERRLSLELLGFGPCLQVHAVWRWCEHLPLLAVAGGVACANSS